MNSFFDPEGDQITLFPNSVSIEYNDLRIVAKAYFLMGNDIPGPPPLNAEAASYFGIPVNSNAENRELLYCEENSPALGTGVALGASLNLKFEDKRRRKFLGKERTFFHIVARGDAGFDIALLKYGPETYCTEASPGDPHGVNGFRATGNIWAKVRVDGKVLGFKLVGLGLGILMQADMPNPSYFRCVGICLLYTSPSPRDGLLSRMPSSA